MKGEVKVISRLMKPHRRLIFFILILQAIGAIAQVLSITLLKPILNEGIYGNDMDRFYVLAFYLLILTVTIAAIMIMTTRLSSRVATSVAESLRTKIMEVTVNANDLNALGSTPADAMVCLINDVATVQKFVFEVLRTYSPMPILLLLLVGYTFATNVIIGFIIVITLVIVSVLSFVFTVRIRPLYSTQLEYIGQVNSSLREKVTGARTIRTYGGYDYEVKKFSERSTRLGEVNTKIMVNSYYIPSIAIAGMWIFIVFLFMAAALDMGTALKASELIIFMQFATSIVATLALVPFIGIDAPRTRVCFAHIREIVGSARAAEKKYDEKLKVANTIHCFSARNVVMKDRLGRTVLNDVSLDIEKGRTVTFVGPNGSGASHLIRMALGFAAPDSGKVIVNGMDVSTTDPRFIRDEVAYAGNATHILRGTVRYNIDPHGRYTDEQILDICDRVGLDTFMAELPDGLDTQIHQASSSMSGGQKMLVLIARSLLKDTQLYIFDDCLFSLDANTKAKVVSAISEICKGKSVIFLMHDTSICESSDKIIVMRDGKVVDQGTHSELLDSSTLYNELYGTGQGRKGSWA